MTVRDKFLTSGGGADPV